MKKLYNPPTYECIQVLSADVLQTSPLQTNGFVADTSWDDDLPNS